MKPIRVFDQLWRPFAYFLIIIMFAGAGTVLAQTSGTITGRISDANSEKSLEGATVEIVELQRSTTTDPDGSYLLRGIPSGEYTVRVVYYGLEPLENKVTIADNETTTQAFAMQGLADMDEIVVRGTQLAGQSRAINQQRAAKGIKTIINEELFGSADDGNIGEVLQRLPGLSVDSDGFSEIPRYVNIRGISTAFNSVQVDGARLAVSGTGRGAEYGDTGRGFALDDLPADAITNIEIIKAPTPDMDGDGLGGIVNLRTKSALDYGGRRIDFTAGYAYNALRDESFPSGSGTFNDIFELSEGRRLGVSMTMSYYETNEGFNNLDQDYKPLRPADGINQGLAVQPIANGGLQPFYDPMTNSFVQGPGIAAETSSQRGERPFGRTRSGPKEALFYMEDIEYNTFLIDRERIGFAGSFDLEVDETLSFYAKPLYSKEDQNWDDIRYHPIMDNDHEDGCSTPYDEAAVLSVLDGLSTSEAAALTSADFGAQACYLSRRLEADGSLSAYPVRLGSQSNQRSTIDFVNENRGRATYDINGNGRGLVEYFENDTQFDIELLSLSMGGKKQFENSILNVDLNYSTTSKTADGTEGEIRRRNFAFEYDRSDRFSGGNTYSVVTPTGRAPLDINDVVLDPARRDVIFPGFLFTERDEVEENRWQISADYERDLLNLQDYGFISGTWKVGAKYVVMDREFDREVNDHSLPTAAVNPQFYLDHIRNNSLGSVDGQFMPYFLDSRSAVNATMNTRTRNLSSSEEQDYTFDENYWAAYWMASIQAGPLEVTGGFRAEFTEFSTARAQQDEDTGIFTIQSDSNSYNNILPSLHIKYDITEQLVLRASLGETFSRPQMLDLLNTRFISENDDPVEIEEGNPDLPPLESRNTDIALEWYGDQSFYSIGYFKKDMTGFSFPLTTIIESDPNYEGREVRITTPLATGTAINEGWELSAFQRFGFLPSPWNGLFINSNYTLTDSVADYPDRTDELPTRGASEHLFFFSTGYEWDRFTFSVSYRYRSPYIEGLSFVDQQGENNFIEDDNFGEQEIVDLDFSARLTDNFELVATVSNLFDEIHASRQGYLDSPEDIYFNKRRVMVGIKGSF